MINYISKRKEELIILAVALVCCLSSYAFEHHYIIFTEGFKIRFSDADDYMMLTRIRDFFIHGDLAYSLVNRVNVPYGTDIYWSRLYDFFVIVPVWIVNLFVGSINKSVEYVCFFITPIMNAIMCIVVYSLFQKITDKKNAFLGALLFAIIPSIGEISTPGRPDHHIFIMLMEVGYLYTFANIFKNNCEIKSDYIISGISAAICIWTAIEILPLVLLSEVILFFFSRNNIKKLKFLYVKSIITTFLIGMIIFLSFPITSSSVVNLAITAVIFSFSINELDYWHVLILGIVILAFSFDNTFTYDKISVMHFVLYLCGSLYFAINVFYNKSISKNPMKFAIALGILFGSIFLHKYPNFLLGVEGGASEFLREIWFPKIQDLTSPFESGVAASICFCLNFIILFIAIYNKICELINKKFENINIFWWFLIILNIVYFGFTVIVRRFIPTLSMISLFLILDFGLNGIAFKFFSRKTKYLIACVLVLFPSFVQKYGYIIQGLMFKRDIFIQQVKKEHQKIKQEDEIFKFLNNLSVTPVVIMADPYSGPRILYHTKHNVVSVPFHSQEKGVTSSLVITIKHRATEQETRDILKSTNASYVFIKKSMCISDKESHNFANLSMNGYIQEWGEIVDLNIKSNEYIIVKISKNKI